MTLDELQQAIDTHIGQFREGYWPPLANLARLVEEVGELSRHVNDVHGPKKLRAAPPSDGPPPLIDELGDVVVAVATLANAMGLSLEEATRHSLDKITRRDGERWERLEENPRHGRTQGGKGPGSNTPDAT